MTELDITWLRSLQIWWAYTWRAFLYVLVPGLVIGLVVGITIGILKTPSPAYLWAVRGFSLVAGIPISVYALKEVLEKPFPEFRIALIKRDPASVVHPAAPTKLPVAAGSPPEAAGGI